MLFRRIGITFAVYGEAEGQERLIPFDVLPRILSAREWELLRKGLEKRLDAINKFIADIYTRREVIKAGVIPEDLVFQNPVFRPEMNGKKVPHGIYVHIGGIDIVRTDADTFYVLEDNVRAPSASPTCWRTAKSCCGCFRIVCAPSRGASRKLSGRAPCHPDLGRAASASSDPTVILLTPGDTTLPITNTRFWPTSWASSWSRGATFRQGRIRIHANNARAQAGRRHLSAHRRRFLDPLAFRPDSALGVPGLMAVYQTGMLSWPMP